MCLRCRGISAVWVCYMPKFITFPQASLGKGHITRADRQELLSHCGSYVTDGMRVWEWFGFGQRQPLAAAWARWAQNKRIIWVGEDSLPPVRSLSSYEMLGLS